MSIAIDIPRRRVYATGEAQKVYKAIKAFENSDIGMLYPPIFDRIEPIHIGGGIFQRGYLIPNDAWTVQYGRVSVPSDFNFHFLEDVR